MVTFLPKDFKNHFDNINLKEIIFGALGDYRIKLLPANITNETTLIWIMSYFLFAKEDEGNLNSFLRNYVKPKAIVRLKSLLNNKKEEMAKREAAIAILKDTKEGFTLTLNKFKKIVELCYIPGLITELGLSSSSENISSLYRNINRKKIWKRAITWFKKKYLNDWQKDIESLRIEIRALEKEIKWWQEFYELNWDYIKKLRKVAFTHSMKLNLPEFTADLKNRLGEISSILELISKEKHKRMDIDEMRYEPTNENEVLFLTGVLIGKGYLPFRIREIHKDFPDMIVDYYTPKGWKKYQRVEVEYESINFLKHKHKPSECDIIVCWRHNWNDCPKEIEIIELKNFIKSVEK